MPFANVYNTNGGYGGVLQSIKHHLPMVAAGLHEGKNEICSRIGYFKYGINLNTETPSVEAIRGAVESVLDDSIYKDNISKLSQELSTYNALEKVAGYISELLDKYVTYVKQSEEQQVTQ
jgi:UDP:flavonoid glycosyltransferase YjiC (YdhE family)